MDCREASDLATIRRLSPPDLEGCIDFLFAPLKEDLRRVDPRHGADGINEVIRGLPALIQQEVPGVTDRDSLCDEILAKINSEPGAALLGALTFSEGFNSTDALLNFFSFDKPLSQIRHINRFVRSVAAGTLDGVALGLGDILLITDAALRFVGNFSAAFLTQYRMRRNDIREGRAGFAHFLSSTELRSNLRALKASRMQKAAAGGKRLGQLAWSPIPALPASLKDAFCTTPGQASLAMLALLFAAVYTTGATGRTQMESTGRLALVTFGWLAYGNIMGRLWAREGRKARPYGANRLSSAARSMLNKITPTRIRPMDSIALRSRR